MSRFVLVALVVVCSSFPSNGLPPDAVTASPTTTLDTQNQTLRGMKNFEPVAFNAVHATQNTRKSSNKLSFTRTVTDIGIGWYADRGEFVCFYPGVYFFTFSAIPAGASQFRIGLMRNNEEIVSAVGDRTGSSSGSNSAVLNLNKNDRVYLVLAEGSIHESKRDSKSYTSFSGFRIY